MSNFFRSYKTVRGRAEQVYWFLCLYVICEVVYEILKLASFPKGGVECLLVGTASLLFIILAIISDGKLQNFFEEKEYGEGLYGCKEASDSCSSGILAYIVISLAASYATLEIKYLKTEPEEYMNAMDIYMGVSEFFGILFTIISWLFLAYAVYHSYKVRDVLSKEPIGKRVLGGIL